MTNTISKPCANDIAYERKLGRWLAKQERDFINGTGEVTHNPRIRAKWIEFISDPKYSKYLRVKMPM